MIALALRTGIPMSEWDRAGGRAIATAIDLINDQDRPVDRDAAGRQMSG